MKAEKTGCFNCLHADRKETNPDVFSCTWHHRINLSFTALKNYSCEDWVPDDLFDCIGDSTQDNVISMEDFKNRHKYEEDWKQQLFTKLKKDGFIKEE